MILIFFCIRFYCVEVHCLPFKNCITNKNFCCGVLCINTFPNLTPLGNGRENTHIIHALKRNPKQCRSSVVLHLIKYSIQEFQFSLPFKSSVQTAEEF